MKPFNRYVQWQVPKGPWVSSAVGLCIIPVRTAAGQTIDAVKSSWSFVSKLFQSEDKTKQKEGKERPLCFGVTNTRKQIKRGSFDPQTGKSQRLRCSVYHKEGLSNNTEETNANLKDVPLIGLISCAVITPCADAAFIAPFSHESLFSHSETTRKHEPLVFDDGALVQTYVANYDNSLFLIPCSTGDFILSKLYSCHVGGFHEDGHKRPFHMYEGHWKTRFLCYLKNNNKSMQDAFEHVVAGSPAFKLDPKTRKLLPIGLLAFQYFKNDRLIFCFQSITNTLAQLALDAPFLLENCAQKYHSIGWTFSVCSCCCPLVDYESLKKQLESKIREYERLEHNIDSKRTKIEKELRAILTKTKSEHKKTNLIGNLKRARITVTDMVACTKQTLGRSNYRGDTDARAFMREFCDDTTNIDDEQFFKRLASINVSIEQLLNFL